MSARGVAWVAAPAVTALGVRLPSTPVGTPWREYWPLFVLAGLVVLFVLWQTRAGRRARVRAGRGGGRLASLLRSAGSASAWDGGSSAAQVDRWQERSRRNRGLASGWSVLRRASGWSLLLRAGVLRPSLRHRWFVRALAVGSPLARVGRLLRVWSSCEDVTTRVGGPRTGKSGELACRILDAPGAVIATSTRTDLYELCGPVLERGVALSLCTRHGLATAALLGAGLGLSGENGWLAALVSVVLVAPLSALFSPRIREGRPVHVFNPSGVAGLASTVVFNPLTGCEVPKTATERAADLLQGANLGDATSGEREFWVGQARRVLAALLHAAALGGCSMLAVQEWLARPKMHANDVEELLRDSTAPSFATDAAQFFGTNERTQSSITTTVMPALAWLSDATAYEATQPTADGKRVELNVELMLELSEAVFMIGAEEAHTAPLVTAFTSHIAREARRLAALAPGGRLDPPLTLVLDEAAIICPVALDRWTADMGGRNITIHIGAQSYAQLADRFGPRGADAIFNNTATLMVFGGTRSTDDLSMYSMLADEREVSVPTWDAAGRPTSTTSRREPVLSRGQIAGLPKGHVLVIKRDLAPMIGRVRMGWTRHDVKTSQRAIRWERRVDAVAAWATRAQHTAQAEPVTPEQERGGAPAGGLRQRVGDLAVLVGRRRARRQVVAAQRRARKRGL